MAEIENRFERNRRGRFARQPVSNPGVTRYVATYDQQDNLHGVVGATYHPVGDTSGFRRAPLTPLDRPGRRDLVRYTDDHNGTNRMSTWPPRDQYASDLTRHKDNYRRVRR